MVTSSPELRKDLIDRYVLGLSEDSDEYSTSIQAIRHCLFEKQGKDNQLRGAIVFCNYDDTEPDLDSRMKMKIFVLNENMIDVYGDQLEYLSVILAKTCGELRPYREMDHFEHFRKNYRSVNHWDLTLRNEEYETNLSLEAAAELLKNDFKSLPARKLDAYIFKFSEALVIPIPVLSSPSFLLILDMKQIRSALRYDSEPYKLEYVRNIQRRTSEILSLHITQRLLLQFNAFFKEEDHIFMRSLPDENQLLLYFCRSVSKTLFPISFEFTRGSEIYKENIFNWFNEDVIDTNHENRKLELYLLDKRFKVSFVLPTFVVPVSSKGPSWLIHTTEEFPLKRAQIKVALESLFELIYRFWDRVRENKEYAEKLLKETIRKSDYLKPESISRLIDQYKKNLSQSEDFLKVLTQVHDEVGNLSKIDFSQPEESLVETIVKVENGFRFNVLCNKKIDTFVIPGKTNRSKGSKSGANTYMQGLENLQTLLSHASKGHIRIEAHVFDAAVRPGTRFNTFSGRDMIELIRLFQKSVSEVYNLANQIFGLVTQIIDGDNPFRKTLLKSGISAFKMLKVSDSDFRKIFAELFDTDNKSKRLKGENRKVILQLMQFIAQFMKEQRNLSRVANFRDFGGSKKPSKVHEPQNVDASGETDRSHSDHNDASDLDRDDDGAVEREYLESDHNGHEMYIDGDMMISNGAKSLYSGIDFEWSCISTEVKIWGQFEKMLQERYPAKMQEQKEKTSSALTKDLSTFWANHSKTAENDLISTVQKSLKACFEKIQTHSSPDCYMKVKENFIQAGLAKEEHGKLLPQRNHNLFVYDQSRIRDTAKRIDWKFSELD